jgi:hypothetical protein
VRSGRSRGLRRAPRRCTITEAMIASASDQPPQKDVRAGPEITLAPIAKRATTIVLADGARVWRSGTISVLSRCALHANEGGQLHETNQ